MISIQRSLVELKGGIIESKPKENVDREDMPELPEVEYTARQLRTTIVGATISNALYSGSAPLDTPTSPHSFDRLPTAVYKGYAAVENTSCLICKVNCSSPSTAA